jgi:serine/alanine adding enzyme
MLDIFFTSEYGKLNELVESGTSVVYNFECEYGTIRHVFIKRRIDIPVSDITYYDIVSPYGYGGPVIIESNNKEKLILAYFNEFSDYCSKNNIISEFIRFHLFDNIDVRTLFYGETYPLSNNIIRDFELSMDEIWMEFEHKVRKNVKRALSKKLTIEIDFSGLYLSDFLKIYYATMDRNNARDYYYFTEKYFEELNLNLKGHYAYFHTIIDSKIISTELVLFSDKYVYSFLGGTIAEFYDYRPNDFLKYEIIKWCKETQKEKFILGGGYTKDDGISRYKKGFAPSGNATFYIGKKIHDQAVYNKLLALKTEQPGFDVNTKFFPAYRG